MSTEENKYIAYMPVDGETEIADPIEVPGQDASKIGKDVMFRLEMQIPEIAYLKPIRGRISSKFNIIIDIITVIEAILILVLIILAPSKQKIWWIVLEVAYISFLVFMEIYVRNRRKKEYEKTKAAKEDQVIYTFYADEMNVKNPNIEGKLLYENAEFYAETKDIFVMVFPFSRNVAIDKSKCTEGQLDFLRSVVPEKNQRATEKKAITKGLIKTLIMVVYIALLIYSVCGLARVRKIMNSYEYTTQYEDTTYDSFIDCVGAGTIKDVEIYEDRYIEYTFVGRGIDERYYTTYDGDMNVLTMILDSRGVNWKKVK